MLEFLDIIEPLAHPERFGGDAKDGFTVVVPSLPGYGFSGKPLGPISPRTIARLFNTLMVDVLDLPGYIAQGGDWGSSISGWLGYDGKGCRAVHMNMMGWLSPGVVPETDEERRFAETSRQLFDAEGAYFREQSTKPQTLSYAMMDSPVGACAWIVEKFHGWSDLRRGFENIYTRDQLLTNVMVYLVTRSFNTATWLYRGLFEDFSGAPVPPKSRVEKTGRGRKIPRRPDPVPAAQPGREKPQCRALDGFPKKAGISQRWSARTIWWKTSARLPASCRNECAGLISTRPQGAGGLRH